MADRITSPNGSNTVIATDDDVVITKSNTIANSKIVVGDDDIKISKSGANGTSEIEVDQFQTSMENTNTFGNNAKVQVIPGAIFSTADSSVNSICTSLEKVPSLGNPTEPDKTASRYDGFTRTFGSRYLGVFGSNPYERPVYDHLGNLERYDTDYRDSITFEILSNDDFNSRPRGLYAYHGHNHVGDSGSRANNPFIATHNAHLTTKKYVDDNSNKFYTSTTQPTSMKAGDGWFNPSTGELKIYTE